MRGVEQRPLVAPRMSSVKSVSCGAGWAFALSAREACGRRSRTHEEQLVGGSSLAWWLKRNGGATCARNKKWCTAGSRER